MTIAKDVKIQVEFNPAYVKNYRLISYDNRRLRDEDFTNDKIDAGDIGSGHTVTALYEIEPVDAVAGGPEAGKGTVEPLKYQKKVKPEIAPQLAEPEMYNHEWMTVKLRYKLPEEKVSRPLEVPLVLKRGVPAWQKASKDFRFASAVAGFGLILRESEHKGNASSEMVLKLVDPTLLDADEDPNGRRAEFVELVRKAQR